MSSSSSQQQPSHSEVISEKIASVLHFLESKGYKNHPFSLGLSVSSYLPHSMITHWIRTNLPPKFSHFMQKISEDMPALSFTEHERETMRETYYSVLVLSGLENLEHKTKR